MEDSVLHERKNRVDIAIAIAIDSPSANQQSLDQSISATANNSDLEMATTVKQRSKGENNSALASGVADSLFSYAPEWAQPYLKKLDPVIRGVSWAINASGPVFDFLYSSYVKIYALLEPYDPELLFPMFMGLMMILFGGYFMLTIACVEAYRISGWDTTRRCLIDIYANYIRVKEASAKDDQLDEDNDGVADVQQISEKELVTRKLKLFLRSCDPVQVSDALSGIYTGFLGVVATLQIQFARTLALGVSIGEAVHKPIHHVFRPILEALIHRDYHPWIDVIIRYSCKLFGVWLAMLLHRVLAAFHSAVRGAQIFTEAFAVYTAKRGYMDLSAGYWDEIFAGIVAFFGLTMQLKTGFSLPWILAIPLFPLLFVEKMLTFTLAYKAN